MVAPRQRRFRTLICLGSWGLLLVGGVAGCASPFKSQTIESPRASEPAPTGEAETAKSAEEPTLPPVSTDATAAVDPDDATIEALRRKSEAYAAALELLLRERAGAAGAASGEVASSPPQGVSSADPAPTDAVPPVATDAPPVRASAVRWLEPDRPGAASVAGEGADPNPAQPPPPAFAKATDDSNTPLALPSDATEVALVTPARLPESSSPIADGAAAPGGLGGSVHSTDAGGVVSRLAKRVKDNPRDVASHLEYQLQLFLLDEPVPNLASIATLPQEDRELLTAVLDGIANLRATLRRDANLLITEKIRPLVELSDRLRTQAELTITTLTLCARVDGFGRYEPMEPRFIAGRESPMIVYCEIENFSSQYDQQQWQTDLSMEMSLFSEQGQQVYVEQPVLVTDSSRSRRNDFFLRKLVKLPSNLTIGRYVLKVTIVDTQSNRVAESSLPMQIVAQ